MNKTDLQKQAQSNLMENADNMIIDTFNIQDISADVHTKDGYLVNNKLGGKIIVFLTEGENVIYVNDIKKYEKNIKPCYLFHLNSKVKLMLTHKNN